MVFANKTLICCPESLQRYQKTEERRRIHFRVNFRILSENEIAGNATYFVLATYVTVSQVCCLKEAKNDFNTEED